MNQARTCEYCETEFDAKDPGAIAGGDVDVCAKCRDQQEADARRLYGPGTPKPYSDQDYQDAWVERRMLRGIK